MSNKTIEQVRDEFILLVDLAGNDAKAAEIIKNNACGFGPDRSMICRIRNGQGKPSMIGMATALLRMGLNP